MNIRLYNARVLTMEHDKDVFFGEVHIKDNKIVRVTAGIDSTGTKWDREIDCEQNLLMPGFKNAHTHSAMTFLRSFADDLPLKSWLNEKVFPMEAKLTDRDAYVLNKLAILEYLSGGITAVFDMYIFPDAMARACTDLGMKCVLVSGLNDFTSSPEQMEEEYLKYNRMNPLVRYCLGFHAEYTCKRELLTRVAALSQKYKSPVYAHISETEQEVNSCMEKYGMTPVAFLASLGMFEYGGGGYHLVHTTGEEMEILKKKKLFVVTNPASNLKLASGIAPIARYLENEIPVAIGTDGPASNNCLDMFREMFLVSGLSKVREKDASATEAKKVLEMACVNGALAMGLTDADVLAPGKKADLILLDLKMPNMQPIHNIPKNIVYSGNKSNVKMTMVEGNILYQNGEYKLGESAEDIYREVAEVVDRLSRG